MVAGDRDAVELRHVLRRVGEDVRNDAHRRRGRINVGVAHHELLEDVVLDRAREVGELGSLFERGADVESHDREHRAVHRHGDGNLVERDATKERLHVED